MTNLKYEKRLAGGLLFILLLIELVVIVYLNNYDLVEELPYSISCLLSELLMLVPSIIIMGIWYFIHIWKVSTNKEAKEIALRDRLMYKVMRPSNVLLSILFTLLIMPLVTFCNGISMLFTENVIADEVDNIMSLPLPLAIFFVAVVPAMCEEFVFRGVIYGGFRRCCRPIPAIFVSALLFGLMHLNINQFCYTFPIGILAALIVEATGSIWSSIILHFCVNASSVLSIFMLNVSNEELLYQVDEYSASNLMLVSELLIYGVIAAITVFLACLLLVGISKREKRDNPLVLIRDSRSYKGISIISIPLFLSVVVSVGIMIFMN